MSQTLDATFDGAAFQPDLPPNSNLPGELVPGARYRLTVEALPSTLNPEDVWSLLAEAAGSVQAPPDWAEQHDHYLYGTAKQEPGHEQ